MTEPPTACPNDCTRIRANTAFLPWDLAHLTATWPTWPSYVAYLAYVA